ncbi:hypothetical protein LTR95_012418, partial [Oleoguttula sp. CCFEE 5521]
MQSRNDFTLWNGALGDPNLSGVGTAFPDGSTDEPLQFDFEDFGTDAAQASQLRGKPAHKLTSVIKQRQYDDHPLSEPSDYQSRRSTWDPGATNFPSTDRTPAYRHVAGPNAGAAELAIRYFTPLQARPARVQPDGHRMQLGAATSAPQAIPMQQQQIRWAPELDDSRPRSVRPSSVAGMSDGYMRSGITSRLSQSAQSSALTHTMQYPQSARQAPYQTLFPSQRPSTQSRAHSNSDPAQRVGPSTQSRMYGNPKKQRQQQVGFSGIYNQQYQHADIARDGTFSPPRTQGSWSHYAGSESADSQVLPDAIDAAYSTGMLHSPISELGGLDPRFASPPDIEGWTGQAYNPGDRSINPNQLMAHSAPARPYQAAGPSRPRSVSTSMSNMDGQYVCTSPICRTPNATFRSKADLEHHQRWHGPRNNVCEHCGAPFVSSKDLKRHIGERHDPDGRKYF